MTTLSRKDLATWSAIVLALIGLLQQYLALRQAMLKTERTSRYYWGADYQKFVDGKEPK